MAQRGSVASSLYGAVVPWPPRAGLVALTLTLLLSPLRVESTDIVEAIRPIAAGKDVRCALEWYDPMSGTHFRNPATGKETSGSPLSCWGRNNAVLSDRPTASSFTAVFVSRGWACAYSKPRLECWGNPIPTNAGTISGVPTSIKVVSAGLGKSVGCAVRKSGSIDCWGVEPYAWWDGSPSAREAQFKSIAVGSFHSCALTTNGQAVCYGDCVKVGGVRIDGCLSPGSDTLFEPYSLAAPHATKGKTSTCGIEKGTLEVLCWGNGYTASNARPIEGRFTSLALNGFSSSQTGCGIRETSGSVACWSAGESGDAHGQASPPPGLVFERIDSASYSTSFCGLLASTLHAARNMAAPWSPPGVVCWGKSLALESFGGYTRGDTCFAGSTHSKLVEAHVEGLCVPCPLGRYAGSRGSAACLPCAANSASHDSIELIRTFALADARALGSTACVACASGRHSRGNAALCIDDRCGENGAPCVIHVAAAPFTAADVATSSATVLGRLDPRGGERVYIGGTALFNSSRALVISKTLGGGRDADGWMRLSSNEAATLIAVEVGVGDACTDVAVDVDGALADSDAVQLVACTLPCARSMSGAMLRLHIARLGELNGTSASERAGTSAWLQYRMWRNASADTPCSVAPPTLTSIEPVGNGVSVSAAFAGDRVALVGAHFGPDVTGGIMPARVLIHDMSFDLRGNELGVVDFVSPTRIELNLPSIPDCGYANLQLPVRLQIGSTATVDAAALRVVYLDAALARARAAQGLEVSIFNASALDLRWRLPPIAAPWDAVHVLASETNPASLIAELAPTATSFRLNNLRLGATYTISVALILPGQRYTAEPVVATVALAPYPPTDVTASFAAFQSSGNLSGSVDALIRWNVSAARRGATTTSYTIVWELAHPAEDLARVPEAVGGEKRVVASTTGSERGHQSDLVAGLLPNVRYGFYLRAVATVPLGLSPTSVDLASPLRSTAAEFHAFTPLAPKSLVAQFAHAVSSAKSTSGIAEFYLQLNWQPSDDGGASIVGWEIELAIGGGGWIQKSTVRTTGTAVSLTDPMPLGTTVCARVAGTNALGTGALSDSAACITAESQRKALESTCASRGKYYLALGKAATKCLQCPEEVTQSCLQGRLELAPNIWFSGSEPTTETAVWPCFNRDACVENHPMLRIDCRLELGYMGVLCGGCDLANGFMRNGGDCSECWSPSWSAAVTLVCALLLFGLGVYIVGFYKFHNDIDDFSACVRKQLFSFLQMLGVLGIFRASGTALFNEAITRPANIVGGSFSSLLPFKCAMMSQIWGPFLFNIATPFIALLTGAAIALPLTLSFRLAERQRRAFPPTPPLMRVKFKFIPDALHSLMPCAALRIETTKAEQVAWTEAEAKRLPFDPGERLQSLLAFVLYGLYPTLVASTMSIFHCSDPIDGIQYLVADMTVQCYRGIHILFVVLACVAFIVYCLGIPLLVTAVVTLRSPSGWHRSPRCCNMYCRVLRRRSASEYDSNQMRVRYGFLFHGYRMRDGRLLMQAWEAVVMYRKLVVTVVATVVAEPHLQLLTALVVLFAATVAQAVVAPYERGWLNSLDLASLCALVLTQILSIVYLWSENGHASNGTRLTVAQRAAAEWSITVLLFAINAFVIVSFTVGFVVLWCQAKGLLVGTFLPCARCTRGSTAALDEKCNALSSPDLKSVLSDGWTEHVDATTGELFYYNETTQETRLERPSMEFMELRRLGIGAVHEAIDLSTASPRCKESPRSRRPDRSRSRSPAMRSQTPDRGGWRGRSESPMARSSHVMESIGDIMTHDGASHGTAFAGSGAMVNCPDVCRIDALFRPDETALSGGNGMFTMGHRDIRSIDELANADEESDLVSVTTMSVEVLERPDVRIVYNNPQLREHGERRTSGLSGI